MLAFGSNTDLWYIFQTAGALFFVGGVNGEMHYTSKVGFSEVRPDSEIQVRKLEEAHNSTWLTQLSTPSESFALHHLLATCPVLCRQYFIMSTCIYVVFMLSHVNCHIMYFCMHVWPIQYKDLLIINNNKNDFCCVVLH